MLGLKISWLVEAIGWVSAAVRILRLRVRQLFPSSNRRSVPFRSFRLDQVACRTPFKADGKLSLAGPPDGQLKIKKRVLRRNAGRFTQPNCLEATERILS
jgi:hypothetical protein